MADWVSELQTLKGSPTGSSAPPHFLKEHDDKLLYRPHATSELDFSLRSGNSKAWCHKILCPACPASHP